MTPNFCDVLKFLALAFVLSCGLYECCHAAPGDTDEFVTGVLTVPFKFHLSDKSTTVGATLGGYIGYQTKTYHDLTLTPVIGSGASSVPLVNGNQLGFSLASGLIGTVGPGATGVQVGMIFGLDWVGRSQHYAYEGKPWLALEVGFQFGH